MKTHEKKRCSIDDVTEYNSNVNVVALKNKIVRGVIEYQRKLELGREIKEIVHELNAPTVSQGKGDMEALQLFENHVQVKHDDWNEYQRKLELGR